MTEYGNTCLSDVCFFLHVELKTVHWWQGQGSGKMLHLIHPTGTSSGKSKSKKNHIEAVW